MSLKINITGSASSFVKAVDSAESRLSRFNKVGVAQLAKGAAVAGAAIAGIGVAAGAMLYKLVKIGEAANTSDERLRSITRQMGLFGSQANKVSDRLRKFGDAQEVAFGMGGLPELQAKLMTFSELAKTADQAGGAFDRVTVAAIDMAAAGFGSAETNAVKLAKALQNPERGIKQLTIAGAKYTEEEKAKIKTMMKTNDIIGIQSILLDGMERRFSGTAAATANATDKMKIAFGQLVDEFSIPVAKLFDKLSTGMLDGMDGMRENASEMGRIFSDALLDSVEGNHDAILGIGSLIGSILKEGVVLGFKGVWTELGAGVLGMLDDLGDFIMPYAPATDPSQTMAGYTNRNKAGYMMDAGYDAIDRISKQVQDIRLHQMQREVYDAGVRLGGTDPVTDPAMVRQIHEELRLARQALEKQNKPFPN